MREDLKNPIVIVEYNRHWPILYEKERKCILQAVGDKIVAIEHIGSTSIPDLGAKNIIDMMAGIEALGRAEDCLSSLANVGYVDVTPQPGMTDWYYCLGKSQHGIGYHLHMVKFKSAHWKKHLVFRDFLRKNPEAAQEYYRLKRELASRYGVDHEGYTEAKTPFIESVLARLTTSNEGEQ